MRDLIYEKVVAEVADSLGLSKRLVNRAYRSYWRVVREHISSLPLKEDLSDEEFAKLQPNVNIPSIGKLYVTAEKYRWLKDKFKQIRQIRENRNAEDNED